jgi:hypothetical protein
MELRDFLDDWEEETVMMEMFGSFKRFNGNM